MKIVILFLSIFFIKVHANEVFKAVSGGDLNRLKYLRDNGSNMSQPQYSIESARIVIKTPLSKAIENSNLEIVEFLLESGVSPCSTGTEIKGRNYESIDSFNCMEKAIDSRNLEILILLLKYGSDPNASFCHPRGCQFDITSALSRCLNIRQRMILLSYGADSGINSDSCLVNAFDESLRSEEYFTAIVYQLWSNHSYQPVTSLQELDYLFMNFPWLQAITALTIYQENIPTNFLPNSLQNLFRSLSQ